MLIPGAFSNRGRWLFCRAETRKTDRQHQRQSLSGGETNRHRIRLSSKLLRPRRPGPGTGLNWRHGAPLRCQLGIRANSIPKSSHWFGGGARRGGDTAHSTKRARGLRGWIRSQRNEKPRLRKFSRTADGPRFEHWQRIAHHRFTLHPHRDRQTWRKHPTHPARRAAREFWPRRFSPRQMIFLSPAAPRLSKRPSWLYATSLGPRVRRSLLPRPGGQPEGLRGGVLPARRPTTQKDRSNRRERQGPLDPSHRPSEIGRHCRDRLSRRCRSRQMNRRNSDLRSITAGPETR